MFTQRHKIKRQELTYNICTGVGYKDEEQVVPQKSSKPPPMICFLLRFEDKINNFVNTEMNLSIDLIQH